MNTKAKVKIGEVLLILGICLFVGGAVGYVTGYLHTEQIPGIKNGIELNVSKINNTEYVGIR